MSPTPKPVTLTKKFCFFSGLPKGHGLIDKGFHPPTVYFPTIVKEAMMIEPTETESKETLDSFVDAMIQIAVQAENEPEKLKQAPATATVCRPNETAAAKNLNIASL
jgi:glycine dehydrogenase subunit 2